MVYNPMEGLYLPKFGDAVAQGLEAGQSAQKGALANYQAQQLQGLQQSYLNAPDEATKKGILQQIAVYNPEHAKGIMALAGGSMNPFEGTSMEAQKANLQYQRYVAAGYPDGEARIRAINDVSSTNAQYYTDPMGNRVTIGGMPLPSVGQPMLTTDTSVRTGELPPLPAYGTGEKVSDAEKVVNQLPTDATPEEYAFVADVMSSPNPAQTYNARVQEHPELARAQHKWNDEVANEFKNIMASPEFIKTGGSVFQPPKGLEPTQQGITSPRAEGTKVDEAVKYGYKTQAELQDVKIPEYTIRPGEKPSVEDAKKVKDITIAKNVILKQSKEYRKLVEKHGAEMYGGVADKMNQRQAMIMMNLKELENLGVLNPGDTEQMEKMIPSATEGNINPWRQENVLSGLDTFDDYIKNRADEQVAVRGYIPKSTPKNETKGNKDIKSISNEELLRMLTK